MKLTVDLTVRILDRFYIDHRAYSIGTQVEERCCLLRSGKFWLAGYCFNGKVKYRCLTESRACKKFLSDILCYVDRAELAKAITAELAGEPIPPLPSATFTFPVAVCGQLQEWKAIWDYGWDGQAHEFNRSCLQIFAPDGRFWKAGGKMLAAFNEIRQGLEAEGVRFLVKGAQIHAYDDSQYAKQPRATMQAKQLVFCISNDLEAEWLPIDIFDAQTFHGDVAVEIEMSATVSQQRIFIQKYMEHIQIFKERVQTVQTPANQRKWRFKKISWVAFIWFCTIFIATIFIAHIHEVFPSLHKSDTVLWVWFLILATGSLIGVKYAKQPTNPVLKSVRVAPKSLQYYRQLQDDEWPMKPNFFLRCPVCRFFLSLDPIATEECPCGNLAKSGSSTIPANRVQVDTGNKLLFCYEKSVFGDS